MRLEPEQVLHLVPDGQAEVEAAYEQYEHDPPESEVRVLALTLALLEHAPFRPM